MRFSAGVLVIVLLLTAGCGPSAQEVAAEQQRLEQARVAVQRTQFKVAIERVLQSDDRTGSVQDLDRRVQAMQRIDTSDCPSEFRSAYLDHIDAWNDLARAKQARNELASDGSIETTLLRSLFASLNNSSETPVEDLLRSDAGLAQLEASASQRVHDTFSAVQKVAFQYGASLPSNR